MDDVTATIEQICSSIKQKYGVAIEHKFLQFAHSPATDKNAPVVEKLKAALKTAHSIDAQLIGIGGGMLQFSIGSAFTFSLGGVALATLVGILLNLIIPKETK